MYVRWLGGLEQYPLTLSEPFSEQGVRIVYWALKNTPFADKAYLMGVNLCLFNSRWDFYKQLPKLISWVKDNKVKAIHFHKSTDLQFVLALRCFLPDVRMIFTEHMNVKRSKKSFYHRLVYKYLDHVIAISDHTRKNNLRALPISEKKITRLYSGVDLKRFRSSLTSEERKVLRKELGLSDETIAIALPGRITVDKRQNVFVEAIERLLLKEELDYPIKAYVIGGLTAYEGSDEPAVEHLKQQVMRSSFKEKIILTGYREDMHNIMQVMDIVCIPSREEPFGLVVIEAMALGLPIVGSSAGAIPEILGKEGEFGLLAEVDNPESFAAKFLALVESEKLRKSLGSAALKRVQESFDLRKHVQGLFGIYGVS